MVALAEGVDVVINLRGVNARRYLYALRRPYVFYQRHRGVHTAEESLGFVQSLLPAGFPVGDLDRRYRCYPSAAQQRRVDRLFAELDIDRRQHIVVGCQRGCGGIQAYRGAFFVQSWMTHRKAWPIGRHQAVAKNLISRADRVRWLLLGAADEAFLARRFRSKVP